MHRLGLSLAVYLGCAAAAWGQSAPVFDGAKLAFPADYREWVYLSSGLGMTYGNAALSGDPNFDNVFVAPAAYREFVKTGRWPEHTMFVLEVRSAASKGSINHGGHYQEGVVAVEAEVKDSARFPGSGWAFFGFETKRDAVGAFPRTQSCYGCHSANGAVDNTFVQFYPTLLEIARAKGTLKTK